MRKSFLSAFVVCVAWLAWALGQPLGCVAPSDAEKKVGEGGVEKVGVDGGGGEATTAKWYLTCGDPACRGYVAPQGVAKCSAQKAGDACSTEGEKCDPVNDCNSLLLCSKTDPRQQVGGCPISTRRVKREIRYLDRRQQEAFHKELMAFRLATYQYRFEGAKAKRRLGFIIEDLPNSPAVDRERSVVDLYQYTSMVVASMQTQSRVMRQQAEEIKLLKAQLTSMQKQLQKLQHGSKGALSK